MNELIPKIRPIVPQSLKGNVISQIIKRKKIMKNIRNYSAIAALFATVIFVPIVLGSSTQTKATNLIEQSISKSGEVKSMVIKYLMRNPFTYNPDVIELNSKMNEVRGEIIFEQPEVWRFENNTKWYIFDGKKSYWHSNCYGGCNVRSRVDASDLGRFNAMFLKSSTLLESIKQLAKDKKANLDIQTYGDSIKLTLKYKVRSIDKSRFMTGDLFGWYNNNLKYSFITDCRQIYVFDKVSKLLQSFDISVHYNNKYLTVLKSKSIVYNSKIEKENIIKIPDSIKMTFEKTFLTNISSKEAVIAILNDLKNDSTSNWNERILFYGYDVNLDYKNLYRLEILEIGEPYKIDNYEGELVPIKIKLNNGIIKSSEVKLLHHKKMKKVWILDSGL